MRFTLATTVLSLASMVIAIPSGKGLFVRGNGNAPACTSSLSIQCCKQIPQNKDEGNMFNMLDAQCSNFDISNGIIGSILGQNKNCDGGQWSCCNLSDAPSSGNINILSNNCVMPNLIG
ncbi:hypothetical protein DSL72_000975 [Monilinia vaccinii-corymbosi]|uniref:Hydrophobin n=1 Tax=Monilinia vaccinii-corymbosi TaxID=61207 RepID=A0A8A3P3Z6_9HELO|nr:hypothetical protein DSL72_000975 [Monilinia vaccinii-corymbosi]